MALAVLVVATWAVRSTGLDHGLPHNLEPDAEISTQLEYIRGRRKGPRQAPDLSTYPFLVAWVSSVVTSPADWPEEGERLALEEHLELASDDTLDVRATVMWFSLLTVPAAFLLALRFVSPGWALFASALTSFSLLAVTFAQQARAHAAAAALVAWAVLACLHLRERGSLCSYAAAGFLVALGIGALHSAVALVFPLAVAHLARRPRRLFDPRALVPLVLVPAAIPVFYPFLLGPIYGQGGAEVARVSSRLDLGGNHAVDLSAFDGSGFARILRTLWWYEPALLGLLLIAALVWIASRVRPSVRDAHARPDVSRGDVLVVLSYVVPYWITIGAFGDTYERFVLPLVPFLACFAVWGLARLTSRVRWPRAVVVASAAVLVLPITACLKLVHLRSRPDTIQLAAEWISANSPLDEPLFLAPVPSAGRGDGALELPLFRSEASLREPGVRLSGLYDLWLKYQNRVPEGTIGGPVRDIRWVLLRTPDLEHAEKTRRKRYLLENPDGFFDRSGTEGLFVVRPDHQPMYAMLRDVLSTFGDLQVRFTPVGTPTERTTPGPVPFALDYQDEGDDPEGEPNAIRHLFAAGATGPPIEIYRLDPEKLANPESVLRRDE